MFEQQSFCVVIKGNDQTLFLHRDLVNMAGGWVWTEYLNRDKRIGSIVAIFRDKASLDRFENLVQESRAPLEYEVFPEDTKWRFSGTRPIFP